MHMQFFNASDSKNGVLILLNTETPNAMGRLSSDRLETRTQISRMTGESTLTTMATQSFNVVHSDNFMHFSIQKRIDL